MKSKNKILLLRIFSALLCFHFLSISIDTHECFLKLKTSTASEFICNNKTESLLGLFFESGIDLKTTTSENFPGENETGDGEEEFKKCTDDDYLSEHKYISFHNSDDAAKHSASGGYGIKEHVSEIIPPPPKA